MTREITYRTIEARESFRELLLFNGASVCVGSFMCVDPEMLLLAHWDMLDDVLETIVAKR